MNRLYSGGESGRLGDDDKKKYYYNNSRRHFKSFGTTSTQPRQKRFFLPLKGIIPTIIILFVFLLYQFTHHQPKIREKTLKDQPSYTRHKGSCSAVLCNPTNKCSTWTPNHPYNWSDLSKAGLFRDLSTIQLDPGCELKVKIEEKIDEGEWLTISEGFTKCTDSGYGTKCRNFVEMELKANVLALAKKMKEMIKEQANEGREIILTHREKDISVDEKIGVTMVSQFSVNRLEIFSKAIGNWQGPISISIYLTQPTDIDELVRFFKIEQNLKTYSRAIITLVKPNYLDNARLQYPINHLRNIAITESSTDYIFVMDADFVPSSNLYSFVYSRLIPFLLYRSGKLPPTAWVVPCFAIHEEYDDLSIPESYGELRRLIGKGIAYITDPGAGHGPTLATEVAMIRPLLLGNTLAYEVCYESQWEPYYILHRSAPLYDVRFKNQGGDKQSHALHLNAERYRFMVLREVFMVHKDHPTMVWPGGGFEKSQKAATNWNYFEGFLREIESLYGGNVRWPRGCSSSAIGWQDQRRNTLGIAAGVV